MSYRPLHQTSANAETELLRKIRDSNYFREIAPMRVNSARPFVANASAFHSESSTHETACANNSPCPDTAPKMQPQRPHRLPQLTRAKPAKFLRVSPPVFLIAHAPKKNRLQVP
jgi:hypothetical protein